MAQPYLVRSHIAVCAAVLAVATLRAEASSIRPAFSPDGAVRCFDAQPFTIWNVYVVADLHDDAAANGITGAEFRITGFDPAWYVMGTPNPAASLALGDPLSNGCNVAFPGCETGVNGIVLLWSFRILPITPIAARTLAASYRVPCFPYYCDPIVTLCDANFTAIFAEGEAAAIPCPPVHTDAVTWSGMKSLFRK
jgi:hypothetical protein